MFPCSQLYPRTALGTDTGVPLPWRATANRNRSRQHTHPGETNPAVREHSQPQPAALQHSMTFKPPHWTGTFHQPSWVLNPRAATEMGVHLKETLNNSQSTAQATNKLTGAGPREAGHTTSSSGLSLLLPDEAAAPALAPSGVTGAGRTPQHTGNVTWYYQNAKEKKSLSPASLSPAPRAQQSYTNTTITPTQVMSARPCPTNSPLLSLVSSR